MDKTFKQVKKNVKELRSMVKFADTIGTEKYNLLNK